jgi:Complex I intermediate-associated protein 30 (CIA30)
MYNLVQMEFEQVRCRNIEPRLDLSSYEGIAFRLKGDGLRYKAILRTDTGWDSISYCRFVLPVSIFCLCPLPPSPPPPGKKLAASGWVRSLFLLRSADRLVAGCVSEVGNAKGALRDKKS